MVDFSAMAGGFRKSMEDDRATRKDIADTFAQFRKDNPFATLQDMQDQINILSGGRNFLRAGLPSTSVLQNIATSNEEAKKQKQFETNVKNLASKTEIRGILEEKANKFLENKLFDVNVIGNRPEDVMAKLDSFKDEFTKTLASEIGELDLNSKELINSVFTKDNATTIREKAIDLRMPKARELIQSFFKTYRGENKTDFTELKPEDLKKIELETGIPQWRLKDEVASLGTEFQYTIGKETNAFIANASPIIEKEFQRYELEWRNGSKTADQIKDLMKAKFKELALREGIALNATDLEYLTDGAFSTLEGTWKVAQKEEIMKNDAYIQAKKKEILDGVQQQLMSGQGAAFSAFERGGISELKTYVASVINGLLPKDTVEQLFGVGTKDEVANRILTELQQMLELSGKDVLNQQEKRFDAQRKSQTSKVDAIIKEEKAAVATIGTKYFGKAQGNYAFTQMANGQLAGGAAEIALNNLAKTYYINDGMANFFIQALKNYTPSNPDTQVTPQEIQDYFISVAGDNLQKWQDRTADLTASIDQGVPERIMKFTEWKNQFQLDADNAIGQVTSNIEDLQTIINSGQVDQLTLPKLNMVLEQIRAVSNEVSRGINQAGQSQAIWVQDGQSDQWNQDASDIMKADLLTKLDAMKEQVEALKGNPAIKNFKQTTTRGEMEIDSDVEGILSNPNYTNAASQRAALQDLFEKRATELIETMQNQRKTSVTKPTYDANYGYQATNPDFWGSADWIRQIIGLPTRQEKYDNPWSGYNSLDELEKVDKFLMNPDSLWTITQSKSRMNSFINDPIAYIDSVRDANSNRTIDIFSQIF